MVRVREEAESCEEHSSREGHHRHQKQAENVQGNLGISVSQLRPFSPLDICFTRYASDQEDSEEEEKILEKHEKPESLSSFVESTRKMFLLQYALEVKLGEKARLETIIKEEEARLKKEESELKLAEQAFDNFLQENDRKAMEAQKKFVFLVFSAN